jgi:thymidylate kinase
MKHIIIFEGPDRTGKSEIGQTLADVLNIAYFKNPNEHNNFKEYNTLDAFRYDTKYILSLIQADVFKNSGIILDRHFPSEYVYAKVYNRKTDENLIWHYDNEFAKLNATIIYCYKSTYDDFSDELISENDIKNIRNVYENDYLKNTKMNIIKLETSNENLQEQISYIMSKLIKTIV